MTYTPQSWTDGSGGGTPISAARLSYLETQYAEAKAYIDAIIAALPTGTGQTGAAGSVTPIPITSDSLATTRAPFVPDAVTAVPSDAALGGKSMNWMGNGNIGSSSGFFNVGTTGSSSFVGILMTDPDVMFETTLGSDISGDGAVNTNYRGMDIRRTFANSNVNVVGYRLNVRSSGVIEFIRFNGSSAIQSLYTSSGSVVGAGDRLSVTALGSLFIIRVNDKVIKQLRDTTYSAAGWVGIAKTNAVTAIPYGKPKIIPVPRTSGYAGNTFYLPDLGIKCDGTDEAAEFWNAVRYASSEATPFNSSIIIAPKGQTVGIGSNFTWDATGDYVTILGEDGARFLKIGTTRDLLFFHLGTNDVKVANCILDFGTSASDGYTPTTIGSPNDAAQVCIKNSYNISYQRNIWRGARKAIQLQTTTANATHDIYIEDNDFGYVNFYAIYAATDDTNNPYVPNRIYVYRNKTKYVSTNDLRTTPAPAFVPVSARPGYFGNMNWGQPTWAESDIGKDQATWLYGGFDNLFVEDNKVNGSWDTGMMITRGVGQNIKNNDLNTNLVGIYYGNRASHALIDNNIIRSQNDIGIATLCQPLTVIVPAHPFVPELYTIITNNTVYDCAKNGIRIEGNQHTKVINNTILGCGRRVYLHPEYPNVSGSTNSATWNLQVTGSPTGGSYTLTVNGTTTAAIAFNANAAAISSALNAISGTTGISGIVATGTTTISIPFKVAVTLTKTSSLTGGTSPNVTLTAIGDGVLNGTVIGSSRTNALTDQERAAITVTNYAENPAHNNVIIGNKIDGLGLAPVLGTSSTAPNSDSVDITNAPYDPTEVKAGSIASLVGIRVVASSSDPLVGTFTKGNTALNCTAAFTNTSNIVVPGNLQTVSV